LDKMENKDVSFAREFLKKKSGKIHFVGAGGVGMAGICFLLKEYGFDVSGCDAEEGRFTQWLKKKGINVFIGHDASHIQACDLVVKSAAVPDDLPEISAGRALNIPVINRGRLLPLLLEGKQSVAVGGTHGKTTTTTFITLLCKYAGLNPAWCIGGEPPDLDGVSGAGDRVIVVEADESDGTLAFYFPEVGLITNVDFDHMEHFPDVRSFHVCFQSFAANSKRIVYCCDDAKVSEILKGFPDYITYGFSANAMVRGDLLEESASGSKFEVMVRGKSAGIAYLYVPGRQNVLNALGAIAACMELGISLDKLIKGLEILKLPGRRFETVVKNDKYQIISDYGHHPAEIAAVIKTACLLNAKRIMAVFQPHRYTRTAALGKDFPPAFAGVDELVLLPVYAASEKPVAGGNLWDLYLNFRSTKTPTAKKVFFCESMEKAWVYFKNKLKEGDLFLVIGAGSVEKIAVMAKRDLGTEHEKTFEPEKKESFPVLGESSRVAFDEPVGIKTTMGTGGNADIWVDIGTEEDLIKVVRWAKEKMLPFNLLGGGSNLLISDLGVRGIVGRLSGAVFRQIREEDGKIIAGCGTNISHLLSWMQERGYGGLEFLAGIPGTVGGTLKMNAGAWDHSICEYVEWIRCIDEEGNNVIVEAKNLKYGYRFCESINTLIAIEAAFKICKRDPVEIKSAIREARNKRAWMLAERCAGSVFKNPAGDFAGKLIERSGFKNMQIGGAVVSAMHANVILAARGAVASDVLALIRMIQDRVWADTGVFLELEIKIME